MTASSHPPPLAVDGPASYRELSRTFWRGVSSTHNLRPAIEAVLQAFASQVGTTRASVWLHDRRARQVAFFASSDQGYGAAPARVAVSDAHMPAARGLRLERAQLLLETPEPVLVAPLRGWRRALGTLVVEGPPGEEADDQDRLDLANDLGRQLSAGIENVQLLEDMLRQRRLLEDTFNSLLDPVVVADRTQRVVQMNDAFANRLNQPRAELLERSLSDLVGADLADWVHGPDSQAPNNTTTREHPGLGGIFDFTTMPLINEDGDPVGTILAARDVTRQTELEAEQEALRTKLTQSEKLASLGQFVAGIAHEINNPLQSVLGHLELLISVPPPAGSAELSREVKKDLRRIYREADRAAKIVRNLLTFTGSHRKTRRRVRVEHVLTRAIEGRRSALGRAGIEIVRHASPDVPAVFGDPLLLQQAFLNVLLNAEHAIVESGTPGTITITTAADHRRVTTTISDTGPGIPPDVLPKIFDPFFTTKDVGQGTGLGLAITYGIVQEHSGTIDAVNDVKGGAIVTITLPAAMQP